MHLIKFETQGESHTAMVNPEQIAFIAEGLYGTSIHFASGEYLICHGDLEDVAARLSGIQVETGYLIARQDKT